MTHLVAALLLAQVPMFQDLPKNMTVHYGDFRTTSIGPTTANDLLQKEARVLDQDQVLRILGLANRRLGPGDFEETQARLRIDLPEGQFLVDYYGVVKWKDKEWQITPRGLLDLYLLVDHLWSRKAAQAP